MKKFFISTCLIGTALHVLILSYSVIATDNNKEITSSDMKMDHSAHKESSNSSIKVEILPLGKIKKGQSSEVKIKLTSLKNDKVIQLSDLKEVHTKKIHILIFDNTLTDYQHVHPTPIQEAGIYQFVWTPKNEGDYRLWVDVVPVQTNNEEYSMAFLDKVDQSKETMIKTLQSTCKVDENEYSLTFDDLPLTQGKVIMGRIKIVDSQGQDVKS